MDSNLIHHPSPGKKMKCSFLDYIQLLMIGRAGQWIQIPSATCLQSIKWNAYFWITFNFWRSARLVNELKPHPQPFSSQRMKCSFLDYVQLLMIGRPGQWTRTPSATSLQPRKWNAHFWFTFNFWWLAGMVDGLKPHLWPLSNQKNEMLVFVLCYTSANFLQPNNEMLIFVLCSTSDDQLGWLMDSNPICNLSPAKKWNAHFCIMFNFWWSARLVDGLEPHVPPLSRHKMKCLFLDYIQLLMIGCDGRWTQTSCATPLQPKKWNAHFWITFNFWWSDDQLGWLMDLNPICHPSQAKKVKCLFLDCFQFLVISQAGWWTQTPSTTPLQPKNKMLIFGLHSTSYDWPAWSMDSNPICNLSPTKQMKCSFLDYVQLLMISQAGQRTRTLSATCLEPKK